MQESVSQPLNGFTTRVRFCGAAPALRPGTFEIGCDSLCGASISIASIGSVSSVTLSGLTRLVADVKCVKVVCVRLFAVCVAALDIESANTAHDPQILKSKTKWIKEEHLLIGSLAPD